MSFRTSPHLTFILLLLAACVSVLHGASRSMPQVQQAIEKSQSSMVLVTGSLPGGNVDSGDMCSAHTGFFIDAKGQVLTSIYAVAGCGSAEVRTVAGQKTDARVVAVEQSSGLALLDTGLKDTIPLQLAEKGSQTGDWVISALAQESGESALPVTYVLGLVISPDASLDLWGVHQKNLIVSNLPVAQGSAGAPLLNCDGRLVGTVLAYGHGRSYHWACYALGPDRLSEVIETLRSGGRRLGWLGMTLRKTSDRSGHQVGAVLEDCPADAAGIKPGDVLLAIDNQPVIDPSVVAKRVVHSRPGTKLRIKIMRDGEIQTTTATVAPRPLLISRKRPGSDSGGSTVLRGNRPSENMNARMRNRLRAFGELQHENKMLRKRLRELQQQLLRLREKEPTQKSGNPR